MMKLQKYLLITLLFMGKGALASQVTLHEYLKTEAMPVETRLNELDTRAEREPGVEFKASRMSFRARPYAKIGIPAVGFVVQSEVELIFVKE